MKNPKNQLKEQCLVLNKSWRAVGIVDVFRSICMSINDRALIINPITFQTMDFNEWVNKGVDSKLVIKTQSMEFDVPEIIMTTHYNNYYRTGVSMTASNIFKRDGNECWYCKSKRNLTLDHIIPRCKNGPHAWTNIVTACKLCNGTKDDQDVDDFCNRMGIEVPDPVNIKNFPWLLKATHGLHDSWKQFVATK
jgi:hypothetical protein